MSAKLTLAVVIILLILYAVFKALTTTYTTLGTMQSSKNPTIISVGGSGMPATIKQNSAISVWFYIKNWAGGAYIVKFKRDAAVLMSIQMKAGSNIIQILPRQMESNTCDIADFPLQKWVNLIVSFNSSSMDVYLDGKLVKSCVVNQGSELGNTATIELGETGKDFGFITNVKLNSSPIAPQEAWDIYAQGFGGSPWSDLLNKYKIKLSFLVDNQEQATVST